MAEIEAAGGDAAVSESGRSKRNECEVTPVPSVHVGQGVWMKRVIRELRTERDARGAYLCSGPVKNLNQRGYCPLLWSCLYCHCQQRGGLEGCMTCGIWWTKSEV